MNAVVFGASGLIGSHLVKELAKRNCVARTASHLSAPIEDYFAVRTVLESTERVTHVFNCVGYTDVEGAEDNSAAAFRINALGAENIARAATGVGAVVIHVSTEFVFDGGATTKRIQTYDEFDMPIAYSVYAKSKFAGEKLVALASPAHHIVRLQSVYGAGGKNNLSTLYKRLASGERLTVENERLIQPTWAGTAAKYLVDIAEKTGRYGVWHVGCAGMTTRYKFVQEFGVGAFNANACGAGSSIFNNTKVSRPSIQIISRRLEMLGMTPVPHWRDALAEYLKIEGV